MKESAGEMLQRLGIDGRLWAEEMHKSFPIIPEEDLIGWCSNMIMAGYDRCMEKQLRQKKEFAEFLLSLNP